MDPPTTADEQPEEELAKENRRLKEENECLKKENMILAQQNLARATYILNAFMHFMVRKLKEHPDMSYPELSQKMEEEWGNFKKEAHVVILPEEIAQEEKDRKKYWVLFCQLCWEFIQIYHPEKEGGEMPYAIYRDGEILFLLKKDITPNEWELYVQLCYSELNHNL